METLQSYLAGRWSAGTGTPTVLVNPTTEESLATCSSEGLDLGEAVRYAREVGGPALRAMSFAERGAALSALSKAIHAEREELIQVAMDNGGCTRGDAKFDIDGATGTLAAYGHLAKSLGDKPYLCDGDGLQLGRSSRFWGRHIFVPREGVAVHINAFNFPTWGMMEKAACALLAGVPVLEKPGSGTALLAARVAKITVDSGLLPEGAFQFLAGSVGDLLDHLGAQDVLAFTGSARTGAKVRGHAGLVAANTRVNVEADSLNAAVLAPDVDASSDTYSTFLTNIVTDMTQKTGQKCTATRRILVPKERVAEVQADLVAELGRIKIGDPTERETRMGPLTSKSQLEDVRKGIERLAGAAEVACGGSGPVQDKGYFVAPTLLVARDSEAEVFHDEEVFGPVASILPYDGTAKTAASLVCRGAGGLVSSVYGEDAAWLREYVLGVAPWHGRVWIGTEKSVGQAFPPGMVLPTMIHGGPGRAGGGEELGGERGLHHYMQRVAVQGFKGLVEAEFGPE